MASFSEIARLFAHQFDIMPTRITSGLPPRGGVVADPDGRAAVTEVSEMRDPVKPAPPVTRIRSSSMLTMGCPCVGGVGSR